MSICVRSLLSSSAGNCLALWTPASSILIDCGVRGQGNCETLLSRHLQVAGHLDGVVVSHKHGDHMNAGALRVLARKGIALFGHQRVIQQLRKQYEPKEWPAMHASSGGAVQIGDFHVTPFEVPHDPDVATFGFVINVQGSRKNCSIAVCTDLKDHRAVLPHLIGADVIFIEANHDLNLLQMHPNPHSRFHLNNGQTAALLHHVASRSTAPPKAVMLGHLSERRNRRSLALGEIRETFKRSGAQVRFDLDVAPAHNASATIEL